MANMIISIMFANEKNLSCLEGLIVQEKIKIHCMVRIYFVRLYAPYGTVPFSWYISLTNSISIFPKPVFQAFLGFLVMATAIVETPVYFVVISCLLNIIMCGVSNLP